MGWRKDFKKQFKERRRSLFDFDEAESNIILWERSYETPNSLTIEYIKEKRKFYEEELMSATELCESPEGLRDYNYVFNSIGTSEYFIDYLTIGSFENTYKIIKEQSGEYAAEVVLLMLKKWLFFTEIKFWTVYNLTFRGKRDFDNNLARKVFEAMKLTGLESINGMLIRCNELLDTVNKLEPYRHYLMAEEIIDIGEEFTWHWSKMLDQVVDSAIADMYNNTTTGDFYSENTTEFDSDFEDFFEKTKTMVFNDELDEAMEYFGITFQTSEAEFKKIYRTLAKQYHPDINKDPSAAIEMKKINMYKTIISGHYESVGG